MPTGPIGTAIPNPIISPLRKKIGSMFSFSGQFRDICKLPPSKMVAFEKKKHVIPRLTRNPESINGSGFRFFDPPRRA
jgi:hypothetical protein